MAAGFDPPATGENIWTSSNPDTNSLWRYTTKDHDFFEKQGVPYIKPLPWFGTLLHIFKKGELKYHLDTQKEYGGDKVVGDFSFGGPGLIVFDADFLSKMMVKEFSSFVNRLSLLTGGKYSDNMLFSIEDNHWRSVRNDMTPTFTSGKLKKMNAEINRCARSLVENITRATKEEGTILVKNYTGAYTMDVIASTAFGIRVNSQEDPNNPFVRNAKEAFDFNVTDFIIIFPVLFPNVAKLVRKLGFSYEFFGKGPTDFFSGVIKQTMAMRKDDMQNTRSDFIQLMIKAQRGEDITDKKEEDQEGEYDHGGQVVKGLTTDEIIANAMVFFTAGYDTTATSLQFFLYNMTIFPEIQQKLVDEIKEVFGKEAEVDYTKLGEMKYLDQCVNENLRLYPPVISVERKCTQDVTINNIHVKRDMIMSIPIYAIHHDPEKWPEPNVFNPERFNAENKKDHHPFHFIPFGHGPRNCIGMRLALLEMKVAIIYMLRAFKFSTCDKTVYPLDFKNKGLLVPEKEIFVTVEARKD